jgi:hypothetical protein
MLTLAVAPASEVASDRLEGPERVGSAADDDCSSVCLSFFAAP